PDSIKKHRREHDNQKMRARKSRHRRNNSRGFMKDITSPLKSQSTYETSLDTQTSDKLNPAELHPTDLS
ncbi:mitogen-activated protein kinase kinase kinase 12, partial [Biomphalaria glabrata]